MLSERAKSLKPSPTLAMAAKAKDMAAKGFDVVSLTVGEPDWPMYPVAMEAAKLALDQGFTKYTAVQGIPEVRTAIVNLTKMQIGVQYELNEVTIGAGAKFILFAALQMLVSPGDEVIIPSPYWVSYPVMAELANGKVKIIDCDHTVGFKLTPELLEKNVTAKSKVLILNSPSNPTGLFYSKEELRKLAVVIKKHRNLVVLSDDIYNQLVFKEESVAPHILTVAPELKDQVVVINGASKSYAMTGLRLGWALGPKVLIDAMTDYMSQSTSNVNSITQKAVVAAIEKGQGNVAESVQMLKQKKAFIVRQLADLNGFKVAEPEGAFYLWADVSGWMNRKTKDGHQFKNSKELAEYLLETKHLAVVPGVEFGCENYLRISFATSQKNLEKAVQRLHDIF